MESPIVKHERQPANIKERVKDQKLAGLFLKNKEKEQKKKKTKHTIQKKDSRVNGIKNAMNVYYSDQKIKMRKTCVCAK